ncbi:MAG TPA: phospho-N-acetylmuramoyl-pentapeptide-transferase [Candidatus Baltobacteraceae bacterium]
MTLSDFRVLGLEVSAGLVISAVVGWVLLRVLPRLQVRQTAYEDAPTTHRQKTGTPTMGGIAIVASFAPVIFLERTYSSELVACYFLVVACAAVGFIDDFLGIRRGKNRGLGASTKYLATALIAVMFLRMVGSAGGDTLFHAGSYALIVPYWLWLLLGILAITGTVHAVNLTDGLDGLATGCVIPPLLAFWCIAISMAIPTRERWPEMLAMAIGGCFGFLIYNRYKAKMFMGDTGSLALGALLAGVAILTGEMLLLILVGGVFVAEALSVIIQVTYFKASKGKRIFRMSPLHHHFELAGWHETKVTARFWVASVVLSAVGLAIVR